MFYNFWHFVLILIFIDNITTILVASIITLRIILQWLKYLWMILGLYLWPILLHQASSPNWLPQPCPCWAQINRLYQLRGRLDAVIADWTRPMSCNMGGGLLSATHYLMLQRVKPFTTRLRQLQLSSHYLLSDKHIFCFLCYIRYDERVLRKMKIRTRRTQPFKSIIFKK